MKRQIQSYISEEDYSKLKLIAEKEGLLFATLIRQIIINYLKGAVLPTKLKDMFKDFKEFKQFMIFCHTHYELNDVWHFENGDKGILFEGAWNNSGGNQKYSPFNLPEEQKPQYAKRNSLEEVYEVWQKVRANLVK